MLQRLLGWIGLENQNRKHGISLEQWKKRDGIK